MSSAVRSSLARARAVGRRRGTEARTVWIMGSPRSGSTWLLNLLHLLTGGVKLDEPLIGAHLAVPLEAVTGAPDAEDRTVLEASASRPGYVFAEGAATSWRPALRALVLDRCTHAAAQERTRAGRTSAPILVKEPNGSRAAPILMSTLPRARLLFLTRDGRDVVDSVLDGAAGGWMTTAHGVHVDDAGRRQEFIVTRARHWVRSTEAVRAAFEAHDDRRRLRTSYEELRQDPVRHLERILRWMGRDDARERVPEVVDRLAFDRIPEDQRGGGRFVRAATPGLWRERFSADERSTLEAVMGPTLVRLGYGVGDTGVDDTGVDDTGTDDTGTGGSGGAARDSAAADRRRDESEQ